MKRCRRILLFCILSLLFAPAAMVAQNDTTMLEGIQVDAVPNAPAVGAIAPSQNIEMKDFDKLPAVQVSDVLKLFSGIVIRDYGGVGGMKTVSVRGFGSQHTAVSYDGILISDCQTGQIDLSKFSLQNADNVALVTGANNSAFIPARNAACASIININTPSFAYSGRRPFGIRFDFTGGSFGLLNPSLLVQNIFPLRRKANLFMSPVVISSFSVDYLQSKGNYPFTLYYGGTGDSTSRERRGNSDIKQLTLEENLLFCFSASSRLKLKFYYYQSERGLPGAVILYHTGNGQRLADQNAFGQVHYENFFARKWAYQVNAKFNFAKQRYLDPDYLNAAGFLDNLYIQREYYLSNVLLYHPHTVIALSLANDLIFGNMSSNLGDFARPQRFQSLTALTVEVNTKRVRANAKLLHTGVVNWAKNGVAADNLSRFCPVAGISVKPLLQEDFRIRAFYQNVFRLPTFNDLYYNEVGNRNLRPENTHQVDLGVTYDKQKRIVSNSRFHKLNVGFAVDGYYNRVKDKIVAIPNKNLFVWSMLNFGMVEIGGLDATVNFRYALDGKVFDFFTLTGSYSLQHAVDVSNRDSKTYGHQIPYTPLHSGSLSANVSFRWFSIGYTMVAAGKRYALQQNVDANLLSPYTDHSLSFSFWWELPADVTLRLKAELLNLADKHYEVIRNYPMPGRSFRITLGVKL